MLFNLVLPVQADSCASLLKATSQQQIQHLSFFKPQKPVVFITLCRGFEPKVFEQFYAYLHPGTNSASDTPKAGLNRIKQILRPEHDVFATGVLAVTKSKGESQKSQSDNMSNELEYQLRMRVRINKGDATDLVMNAALNGGQALMEDVMGFNIMLVQNKNHNVAD